MPWKVEHLPDEQTLLLVSTGLLTAPEARAQTELSLKQIVQHAIPRVLIDYSAAQVEVPLSAIYQLPDIYDQSGVSRQTVVAVVMPKDKYKIEAFEFYEDICLNRGYRVKLFESTSMAWEWLRAQAMA
jgi:hypothetical protein